MAGPSESTCSPWATDIDLCEPCADYEFPVGLIDETLQVASDLLFQFSGRQFPGLCTKTVRPCSQRIYNDPFPDRTSTAIVTTSPIRLACGCTSPDACGCSGLSQIDLGVYPVVSIDEVKVDGAVLPESAYRVDDYKWLVRLDGESWMCCQDLSLADTEVGTFSVTVTYGREVPTAGRHAAAILACELALSCTSNPPGECRLPPKVQSVTRQGVSMVLLNPAEVLIQGRTGIAEVDLFVQAYNPTQKRMPSAVFSPDIKPKARRVDTGGP